MCLCSTSLIWSGQPAGKGVSSSPRSRLKLKALNYTQLQACLPHSTSLSLAQLANLLPRRTWQSTKGRRKCNFKQTARHPPSFIISRLFSAAECSSFADDATERPLTLIWHLAPLPPPPPNPGFPKSDNKFSWLMECKGPSLRGDI